MRITPKPSIAVIAVAVYAALMALVWTATGTDYDTVAESTGSLFRGVVLPVTTAALFTALFTTWLGWWRPAIREETVIAAKWTLIVPVVMALLALVNIVSIDFGAVTLSWIVTLVLGVALVGFGEELTTRGVALVGMRGRVSEVGAWLLTSLLFGLLHGINAFFGQSVPATIRQIVFAFLMASALYVTRMVTGTLVVAMVIHAMWDLGSLGLEGSGATGATLPGIASMFGLPLMIVAVVAAFLTARKVDHAKQPAPVSVG